MVFEKEKPEETLCRIEWEGGDVLGVLFPSFQSGVWVMVPTGIPIGTLLGERWGLSRHFIEKTVGTVFLNSLPVDDVDAERLSEGDVLALSGPMPGLAGAILRKNSPLAGLRHGRTGPVRTTSLETSGSGMVRVRVKLFNTLIEELGRIVLRHGILLEKDHAFQCLHSWKGSQRAKPAQVRVDGEEITFEKLNDILLRKSCTMTLWVSV